jgi:hypothetical protein
MTFRGIDLTGLNFNERKALITRHHAAERAGIDLDRFDFETEHLCSAIPAEHEESHRMARERTLRTA